MCAIRIGVYQAAVGLDTLHLDAVDAAKGLLDGAIAGHEGGAELFQLAPLVA